LSEEMSVAGQRHALVIGVSEYQRVPPLKYADKDAQDVAAALRLVGFSDEHMTLLHGADPQNLPERASVFHHLGEIRNLQLDPDDVVLFYFSGHGMMSEDVDYLLPIEASDIALEDTAVSVDVVVKRLRETGSRRVIMLIDACRNEMPTGKGIHGIGANTKSVVEEAEDGLAVVFSCSTRERSFEIDSDDIKQSSFTYCLLEAMKDPKLNTIAEVAAHLEREVKILNGNYGLRPQLPYLLARPDELKSLPVFTLLDGTAVDVDAYIDFFTELRAREEVQARIFWDVTGFLTAPERDAMRMRLVRDLYEGECSLEQFAAIWTRLRSHPPAGRQGPATVGSVGDPGSSSVFKGDDG
jgi:Caspase domain